MNDASSERRKATAAAISDGWPQRFIICSALIIASCAAGSAASSISRFTIGVSVAPGRIALQRMPCVAYSTAMARTIAPTAPFEIA